MHMVMAESNKHDEAARIGPHQGVPAFVPAFDAASIRSDVLTSARETAFLDVCQLISMHLQPS